MITVAQPERVRPSQATRHQVMRIHGNDDLSHAHALFEAHQLSRSMLELVRRGRNLRFIVVTGHQDWRCRLVHRVIKMN